MEHLPEFFANNLFLCVAFIIVLILTVRAEFVHRANQANQMSPMQATRFMNNENAVVIDVSEVADYENGHINKAINIPMKELPNKLSDLQQYSDKAVLAYCKNGHQSVRACKVLKQSKFSNVHNISGGLQNWVESNLPITK
jgi:rhodanese-related sulfurtransferase